MTRTETTVAPGSETDFEVSLGDTWYISPTQHAVEFLTLAPLYMVFAVYFGYRAFGKSTPAYRLLTKTEKLPPRPLLESICLVLLIASFSTTVIHKAVTGTLLFLMQPCHVSAGLLILVMGWPNHKYPIVPRLLFNIYLHTLWSAILALIWPDLRDHDLLGEIFNFFMEHILVLVLPFYMALTRRYVVMPPSIDMALFSFFLYAAYHSPVLHVSSLLSDFNLNYALVPPALTFLIASGPWFYRFIMYTSALLLMFITRYGLVENFLLLVQAPAEAALPPATEALPPPPAAEALPPPPPAEAPPAAAAAAEAPPPPTAAEAPHRRPGRPALPLAERQRRLRQRQLDDRAAQARREVLRRFRRRRDELRPTAGNLGWVPGFVQSFAALGDGPIVFAGFRAALLDTPYDLDPHVLTDMVDRSDELLRASRAEFFALPTAEQDALLATVREHARQAVIRCRPYLAALSNEEPE